MATTADLLTEARAAHHRLVLGGGVVEVRDANGDSIRYSPANESRLLMYIKRLEAELRSHSLPRGPIRPVWG